MTKQYRIEVKDNGTWRDSEEGPWDTREEADDFARAEIGVEWRIVEELRP